MFKTSISSTPLTSDAANAYFQNIEGECFGNDTSFLATLRALIAPRIKKDETISLRFNSTDYSSVAISSVSAKRAVQAICEGYDLDEAKGRIIVHSFKSDIESNLANFRLIESNFASCYDGYHRLDKVKAFFHKSFAVDCYINPERRNVVVFVDNLDTKRLHYLQVSILAFLPWYFDPAIGVSEAEMELLYSLRETSADNYLRCIGRIAEDYDFRSARVRKLLAGFETRYEKIECERVKSEIISIDRDIHRLNEQIGALYGRRGDTCIKLLGLERKISEGDDESEIMEYFLCNNKLYLESVTNRDMYFAVKEYLSYFDREMAESAINNLRSFVYPHGERSHNGITRDGMKKLMTEIFVKEDPVLRIKFCAAYRFDLNGNVDAQGNHRYDGCEFADYMPNPHIDRYSCMGGYERAVNQLLEHRDYIGALEQCIASCKSLNWGDSPVMGEFMNTMWGNSRHNNRCIELPDGRVVKPAEAIEWIEAQETANNERKEEEA